MRKWGLNCVENRRKGARPPIWAGNKPSSRETRRTFQVVKKVCAGGGGGAKMEKTSTSVLRVLKRHGTHENREDIGLEDSSWHEEGRGMAPARNDGKSWGRGGSGGKGRGIKFQSDFVAKIGQASSGMEQWSTRCAVLSLAQEPDHVER